MRISNILGVIRIDRAAVGRCWSSRDGESDARDKQATQVS